MRYLVLSVMFLAACGVQAQVQVQFPPQAVQLDDAAVQQKITGRVYAGTLGSTQDRWRMEFKDTFVWINTSRNYQDRGKWRVEKGQLCIDWTRNARVACSDVRFVGDNMMLVFRETELIEMKLD